MPEGGKEVPLHTSNPYELRVDLGRDVPETDVRSALRTGDMGFLDDHGYLHLIGREKEMYFRAAFNVYPGEVEDVLQTHPKVAQAAVLGVPDDVLGQKGWAFVVPTDSAAPPARRALTSITASVRP